MLDGATLTALAWILPGLSIDSRGAAIGAAALLVVANAVLWPALSRVTLPLTVLSFGLAALALNGLFVFAVLSAAPGVRIAGVGTGIAVVLGLVITREARRSPALRKLRL